MSILIFISLSQLTQENIHAIVKLQKKYKAYLIKKNLIKAIKMNKVQRHYKNYLKLKESIKKHEKSQNGNFKDSYLDVFMRLWKS